MNYLTIPQLLEKYPFFTKNMVKNILSNNIDGFREKCVKMIGRRILIDEDELKEFIKNQVSYKPNKNKSHPHSGRKKQIKQ
jgi:hypothetical protein